MTAFCLLTTGTAIGQSASIDSPWSGWAQCQINVQGPGYSHSETHTWTLTGGQPTVQGAMRVHPATWKVTGQGSFSRTQGAQTLAGQWTTNATQANAPLAIFVRASDGRLILKSWHSQLRSSGGVAGTQQQTINGVPQTQGAISAEAFEWPFPAIDTVSTNTQISGAKSAATNGSVGPMQPGGSQGTAACSWQFAAGGGTVTSSPPAPSGTNPSGSNPTGSNPTGSNPTGSNPTGSNPTGTNPGGTNPGTGNGNTPSPQIVQLTPTGGVQGAQQLQVTVTGLNTHFAQGTTTLDFGSGITVKSPMVTRSNTVTAQLFIDAAATAGPRAVAVTTGSETATLPQAFNVAPALTVTQLPPQVVQLTVPTLTSVDPPTLELSPSIAGAGEVVYGQGTHFVQGVTTADFGPGTSVNGVDVASSGKAFVSIVITSAAVPGPNTVTMTTGSEVVKLANGFTFTAPPPPPPSGRYRISVNGFRVNHEVNAGLFGREHNAVFAAAAVDVLDRKNNLAVLQSLGIVRSLVHGDTSKGAGRVQAGSASPTGGLLAGDVVPTGQNPANTTLTPSSTTFPLLLWQGPLTDGADAVLIRPVLWDVNGGTETYDAWLTGLRNQQSYEFKDIQTRVNSKDMSPFGASGIDIFCADSSLYGAAHPVDCLPGDDRPIGLLQCYSLGGCWGGLDIVVTRESIEQALSNPYQSGGTGPGVIQIHLADGSAGAGTAQFEGNYDLYLRVERLP